MDKIKTFEEALEWLVEKYPEKFSVAFNLYGIKAVPYFQIKNKTTWLTSFNSDQIDQICKEIGIWINVDICFDISNGTPMKRFKVFDSDGCIVLPVDAFPKKFDISDLEIKKLGLIAWVNSQIE